MQNAEILVQKIKELEDYKSFSTKGYWRDQLKFLRIYTSTGIEAKLLRYVLRKLNVDPEKILEDINAFYDSSGYICSDRDSLFTTVPADKQSVINTFNFSGYRLQFPVPNKHGKFDAHNLAVYRLSDRQRMLLTYLNKECVRVNLFEFKSSNRVS